MAVKKNGLESEELRKYMRKENQRPIVKKLLTNGDRFYGLSIEHYYEPDYPYRSGVEFELVPADQIDYFVNRNGIDVQGKEGMSLSQRRALVAFRRFGLEDDRFKWAKIGYLTETPVFRYILFLDVLDMETVELGEWYELTTDGEASEFRDGDLMEMDSSENPTDTVKNTEPFSMILHPIDSDIQENLVKLYELPESDFQDEGINNELGLSHTDSFSHITVYNVGQGLCSAICSSYVNSYNFLVTYANAFFDFGMDINRKVQTTSIGFSLARASLEQVHPVFVLSHWHADHVNLISEFEHIFRNSQCIWIVPNHVTPYGIKMYQLLINMKQNVLVESGSFPLTQLFGNPNFTVGKIDNVKSSNPHQHGMYANVQLSSGNVAFLSGDTYYDLIPSSDKIVGSCQASCVYLQVCHHGGYYGKEGVSGIPTPGNSGNGSQMAIYSYGLGNRYRHPSRVLDYDEANWKNRCDTVGGDIVVR